jgi:hypothetical protein
MQASGCFRYTREIVVHHVVRHRSKRVENWSVILDPFRRKPDKHVYAEDQEEENGRRNSLSC